MYTVHSVRLVGAPSTVGIGGAPTSRALASACGRQVWTGGRYCVKRKRVISAPENREALILRSLTVLTKRSTGGLGRSLERPCNWSAALSAV